jgi:hypothetical protein
VEELVGFVCVDRICEVDRIVTAACGCTGAVGGCTKTACGGGAILERRVNVLEGRVAILEQNAELSKSPKYKKNY